LITRVNDSVKVGEFSLRPAPPFRLDLTVWALRRPDNLVDRSDGVAYRRVLVIKGQPVEVRHKDVIRVTERFKPFSGLLYFQLLLSNLVSAGYESSYGS